MARLLGGIISIFSLLLFNACHSPQNLYERKGSIAPSHSLWDSLLHQHVHNDRVDYQGFQKDSLALNQYLAILNEHAPSPNWTKEEQLAFWINAYNAFTVKLIVDNYPVNSIRDLHPTPYIPMTNTVWHKKLFQINGEEINLDHIEHGILRKKFEEPRIHFAINCASISCPDLRAEAYTSKKLEKQLDDQARDFINNPLKNKIGHQEVALSKIFSWFKGDFTEDGTLIEFLNQYSDKEIQPSAKVNHLDYNWGLNDIATR